MDALLDTAPCGFLSFGDDGIVLAANQTLLELIGYSADDVIGRHVEQILTIGTRIFYQTHWFPLLRLHGHAEEVFLMLRSARGEDICVLSYARRRVGAERAAYDCVLVRVRERAKYEAELLRARRAAEDSNLQLQSQQQALQQVNDQLEEQAIELELQQQQLRDQTERLESASEELQNTNAALLARTEEAEQLRVLADEANQAKSAFLATMSHELRTPLNAISGYLEILELEIPGPLTASQRDIVARIHKSGRHLLRLINEVLNLARIEAGQVAYHIEPCRLSEILTSILPMVEPQFAAKDIRLTVELPRDLTASADGEKVQQILLNLLSNAVKFTDRNGQVEVRAEPDATNDRVFMHVRDTGIGIPPQQLEAIFQPFVQVDSSSTRTAEGSGLGLAISRDLARGMGGDLAAESAVGRGSMFTLTLPLAKPTQVPETATRG